jgi:hypothetical protein
MRSVRLYARGCDNFAEAGDAVDHQLTEIVGRTTL